METLRIFKDSPAALYKEVKKSYFQQDENIVSSLCFLPGPVPVQLPKYERMQSNIFYQIKVQICIANIFAALKTVFSRILCYCFSTARSKTAFVTFDLNTEYHR